MVLLVLLMGDRKVTLIAVLFGFCLFCSMLDITYAPSENWVEVARFTGGAAESYTTDYFICEHTLWRIRWEWAPNVYYMGDFGFFLNVTTYPEGESGDYIDKIDDSSIVEEVATGRYGGSHDKRNQDRMCPFCNENMNFH